MGQIRADGEVIDAPQVELIAAEGEVVVAEEAGERFEVVAVRGDGVQRNVPFVGEVVEELADLVGHARHSRIKRSIHPFQQLIRREGVTSVEALASRRSLTSDL